jgi:hypothetical protein
MMDGCAKAQGVDIRPGGVPLVQTGWFTVFQNDRTLWDQRQPGPAPSCSGWLKSKDGIALVSLQIRNEAGCATQQFFPGTAEPKLRDHPPVRLVRTKRCA